MAVIYDSPSQCMPIIVKGLGESGINVVLAFHPIMNNWSRYLHNQY